MKSACSSKVIPEISVIYDGDKFPKDFINDVNGWGSYSKEILQKNSEKLLSLDIDFGNKCSLNCPHCFRQNNKVDSGPEKNMTYDNILEVVKQGKELGLKSVKFLGAGEPFENDRFLEFLRELKGLGIVPSIFTKGHVIGDDNLVKKYYYSRYGLSTGRELVKELVKVDASILLGFNSFKPNIQDRMVGNIDGYTTKRNLALKLLTDEGLNKNNPTRLCLAVNPITKQNYNEVLSIYTYARVRGIYVIACPTMISGRCAKTTAWKKITPTAEEIIDLYTKIYQFNIEKGIQTLEQIKSEGISAYAGGHPCNQVGCGMYVTLSGIILRCPGDDTTTLGNVWENGHIKQGKLKEVWQKSENFARSGTLNCLCPPKDGRSIPESLYTEVLKRLEKTGKK
ncbi:MAG: radical SAM protein [Nitrososphaerota archaeon]|jgi:MoaA/NifB/PqqE/SkfB family radical SAM enzyme|nr:radical SAM protein [Nitrososphaerota archaeon]